MAALSAVLPFIANAAGITKRTLYQHFPSKDDLVAAMLEHHHGHAFALIRNWGEGSAKTATELVTGIFSGLGSWASDPGWLGSGFTRLTMELADLPGHPARKVAHFHKRAVEEWLTNEFNSLGVRCPDTLAKQVALLLEGCFSLVLIHQDASYINAAEDAAIQLAKSKEQ